MGWWDSLWSSSSTADDPLRKLDPKLRDFLEKESPIKYNNSGAQPPADTSSSTTTKAGSTSAQATASFSSGLPDATTAAAPAVPKESEYQDGRYAHLWKTYKPLAEIEAETKTDHEKLMDVLEGYKSRKNQIGRAALENCALEQVDWRECMSSPNISDRMTMCRAQVKKFERCYTTQTRLLKALGYLSTYNRTPDEEEEIQMHADALYQRMQAQEAQIEAAKAEGLPIPKFAPLIPKVPVAPTAAAATAAADGSDLTPEQQEALKNRLEKVAEEDRPAEEAAMRAELRSKAELASRVQGIWQQQDRERQVRKEKGEETMWDKLATTFSSGDQKK